MCFFTLSLVSMKHSLKNRIFIGVCIGVVAWFCASIALVYLWLQLTIAYMIWLTLLYVFLWILLAFAGLYSHHPLFNFTLNRRLRGLFFWIMTHLMLLLLSIDTIQYISQSINIWGMVSPYRVLLDGAILWLIMSYFETKIAWEWAIPKR